jgi:hypothetical protein
MTSFRDTALYRVYWWLTSVKLTVVLLSIILVTLIVGTVFEARHGSKAAQFLFYNSRWFDAVLVFFGFNLLCCTIRRFKRRWSQLGFMTTHVGVMTILVGGLMSRNLKQEGQLIVPEGEARSYLLLDRTAVSIAVSGSGLPEGGVTRQYDTHYDKLGGRTEVSSRFRVPEAGIEVEVDKYYNDLRFEERLEDTNPEVNPALDLHVVGWEGERAEPLFARDPERRDVATGGADFRFVEAADAAGLARELGEEGPATTGRLGVVEVSLAGGAAIEIPVDGGLERPFTSPAAPGVAVVVESFYPHFAIAGDQYASRSASLVNPAVLLDVTGPAGGHERRLLFADHPDLDVAHQGGAAKLVAKATYRIADRAPDARGAVTFVRGPDGAIHWRAGAPGGAARRGVLATGEEVSYPEAGIRFWVSRVLEHAQRSEHFWNGGGKEVRNPAIHLTVRDGERSEALWLVQGVPRDVALGDRRVTVDYNFIRHDLGFSVMLEDFREITYPGISMAQSFESDVVVSGPDKQFPRKISMNHPLKFHGYKIFQSSFQRGERETSIFSVARDPGVGVVYTGCFILVLGMILICFLKPYLARMSSDRRRIAPADAVVAAMGGASLPSMAVPTIGGESHAE